MNIDFTCFKCYNTNINNKGKAVNLMPLQIIRQDITKMHVDAIVNTTNEKMIGYSGVDLAVHNAAGKELDELCRSLPPLGLGEVRVTPAFRLDAKYIIHTSGPTMMWCLLYSLLRYRDLVAITV